MDLPTFINFMEKMVIHYFSSKVLIICSRSNNLSEEKEDDFEIIKRNYKNIVDIITYDDLLEWLNNTISFLENE